MSTTRSPHTYVIAEAGVNHNGSLEMALRLVDAAARTGADAVKFQTFQADSVVTPDAPKTAYQRDRTAAAENQLAMLRQLALKPADFQKLQRHCMDLGIEFLSTPFDHVSLDFLVNELAVARLKLPSGEITNGPLLLAAARSGLPIILSTGMADLDEIQAALALLALGYCEPDSLPTPDGLAEIYRSPNGQRRLRQKVTLLQCTTAYPAPISQVNLRTLATLRHTFHLSTGFSDHTAGTTAALAAVALGATVIEKHFTLDRTLPGPDHQASLEPAQLAAMITAIREVEAALGKAEKSATAAEIENRDVVRRGLYCTRDLDAGEVIAADDLIALRPAAGCSPMKFWQLLGTPAPKKFKKGAPFTD